MLFLYLCFALMWPKSFFHQAKPVTRLQNWSWHLTSSFWSSTPSVSSSRPTRTMRGPTVSRKAIKASSAFSSLTHLTGSICFDNAAGWNNNLDWLSFLEKCFCRTEKRTYLYLMRCRFWSKDCEVLWSSRKPAKSVRWWIKGVHDHSHHLDHITRCNTIIFTIWYNAIILTRCIYINLRWNYFSLTRWFNRTEETLFLGFFLSSGQGEGSRQLFWEGQSISIVLVVG